MNSEIICKAYYDRPGGRGWDHYRAVKSAARRLVMTERPTGLTAAEILMLALHDVGVGAEGYTRDQHPEAAIALLDHDESLAPVREELAMYGTWTDTAIRQAVRHHMADSYRRTGILNPYHQLLVEADEGCPVWGEKRIEKPVKYWLNGRNPKMPLDTPLEKVVEHVLHILRRKAEAFVSGKPPFTARYQKAFAVEIEAATRWISTVKEDDVLRVIFRLKGV